jgi:hypothetical protein
MGSGCSLYELKGAGCHCFGDRFVNEWSRGKHGDAVVVYFATGGGSKGV